MKKIIIWALSGVVVFGSGMFLGKVDTVDKDTYENLKSKHEEVVKESNTAKKDLTKVSKELEELKKTEKTEETEDSKDNKENNNTDTKSINKENKTNKNMVKTNSTNKESSIRNVNKESKHTNKPTSEKPKNENKPTTTKPVESVNRPKDYGGDPGITSETGPGDNSGTELPTQNQNNIG
ncbi:hypothetical protein UT300012_40730 [Paraclostridium bifermentans]